MFSVSFAQFSIKFLRAKRVENLCCDLLPGLEHLFCVYGGLASWLPYLGRHTTEMEPGNIANRSSPCPEGYALLEHDTLPDVDATKLLADETHHRESYSVQDIPAQENVLLSVIVSSPTFRTDSDFHAHNRSLTNHPAREFEHSPDNECDDSSTDGEEAYRKLKRRYRRRGFFSSRCCAAKGDEVDGVVEAETPENRLAEVRYEKVPLVERRQRYRERRRCVEGDQVDSVGRNFTCTATRRRTGCSNIFSKLDALHYSKKIIQARGGGGVRAVFDLIKILLTLNFTIGALFLGVVYVPDILWGPEKACGPCDASTVQEVRGNLTNCSEFFIPTCETQKFWEVLWGMVNGGCPVADFKFFAGPYQVGDKYATDKGYFICLGISYFLSIIVIVKAVVNWWQIRQRFKFSDGRNTITTLLFKGWNFSADTRWGKTAEQAFLSQEILSIIAEESPFNFDPVIVRKRMLIHVVSAIFTLVGLSGVALSMYFLYDRNRQVVSLVVMALGKGADLVFACLGKIEQRPNHDELFWLILRGLSFHLMAIGVMVYSELVLSCDCSSLGCTCWETHYAQRIYTMVLLLGAREIFSMTILPLLQFIAVKMSRCFVKVVTCCQKIEKINIAFSYLEPEYRTDAHLFTLIELQTLGWLALPVSPMMPLLVWFVLLLSLAVNLSVVSVMKLRPKRWFGLARSSSFTATALLVSWIMCIWPIMKVMFQRKPSTSCSPFRNLEQQYRALFTADHDLILLLVLMGGCLGAAFLMLFFLLRPRSVSRNPKSYKFGRNYPRYINERRRATECEASALQRSDDFSEIKDMQHEVH